MIVNLDLTKHEESLRSLESEREHHAQLKKRVRAIESELATARFNLNESETRLVKAEHVVACALLDEVLPTLNAPRPVEIFAAAEPVAAEPETHG